MADGFHNGISCYANKRSVQSDKDEVKGVFYYFYSIVAQFGLCVLSVLLFIPF